MTSMLRLIITFLKLLIILDISSYFWFPLKYLSHYPIIYISLWLIEDVQLIKNMFFREKPKVLTASTMPYSDDLLMV